MNSALVNILLVEDNPGDARLIQEMLRSADGRQYALTRTDTLRAALQLLETQRFDVILLDLSLPDSFGVETVRSVHHVAFTPIVVLTGFDDETRGVQAVQAGAQDFLVKGAIDSVLLSRALSYAIERYRVEDALRRNEQEYRSLINDVFNNSTIAALILNRDLEVVWVNDSAEHYFGIAREEVLGGNMRDLVHDKIKCIFEDPDDYERRLLNAFEYDDFAARFECHVTEGPNREDRWLEHWSQPIREGMYAGGRIEQYADITARKRSEFAENAQRALAEALRDTAALLTSTLHLEEVLNRILENVERVVPHDTASVMLIEEGRAQIMRQRGIVLDDSENGTSRQLISASRTPTLYAVLRTGRPLVVPELHQQHHRDVLADQPMARSYAGAPIALQDRIIGFINVFSLQPNFFRPDHADGLAAFAQQAAIALQNAQMYQQSQQLAALEERARLARDLHDSVTQTLFSANVMAESALRRWEKDLSQSYDYLKEVHQLTGSALAEMRVLLMELRPASLSQVKFDQLLQLLVQSLQSRKQLDLSLQIETLPELPAEAKISLYRVVQEAVNNILKHSLATHAAIKVEERGEDLILQIQDNGKGFQPSEVEPPSLGLNFMQERMTKIGAALTIDSAPGKGTLIRVVWPTALGKELDRE